MVLYSHKGKPLQIFNGLQMFLSELDQNKYCLKSSLKALVKSVNNFDMVEFHFQDFCHGKAEFSKAGANSVLP
jgi:hypothetical protein